MKPRKKICNYLEMEQVISKPYLTTSEVMVLAPINSKKAYEITQQIQEEMIERGELIISDRPRLVPTEYVLRKLNLKASQIRQQARAMRGESRG